CAPPKPSHPWLLPRPLSADAEMARTYSSFSQRGPSGPDSGRLAADAESLRHHSGANNAGFEWIAAFRGKCGKKTGSRRTQRPLPCSSPQESRPPGKGAGRSGFSDRRRLGVVSYRLVSFQCPSSNFQRKLRAGGTWLSAGSEGKLKDVPAVARNHP